MERAAARPYVSMMAARRESDVLLTEGHDGAWAFPGPDNSAFGVFPNNPTRIGYGGWQGNAQQVATINVDNEFTDFEEPMAESVIGLFKTEVIRLKGPWRHHEAVEFAALEWVDWFNHRRLLEPIGDMPPAEYEARYYDHAAVA